MSQREIPKIIHQIWIGPNKMPRVWMKTFYEDYIKMFPDWKYQLWTEKEINNLNMINKDIYNQEPTMWGKADIARYEILYKYGGVYVDADSVWINNKNLEECINEAKYTGLFFGRSQHVANQVANGVIGASPSHEFFEKLLNNLTQRYKNLSHRCEVAVSIGPFYVTEVLKDYKFTLFPATYFYPSSWGHTEDYEIHKKTPQPKESFMFQYGYSTNLSIGGNLYNTINKIETLNEAKSKD